MDVSIRTISPEEAGDFVGHVEMAFGHDISPEGREHVRSFLETERAIVAETAGNIIGTTAAFTFDYTVPGGAVQAAGVTMVGVLPSHRRRGVLTKMMHAQLRDVADRGEPLAVLWASEGAIYQRFGYGMAARSMRISILRDRAKFVTPMPANVSYRLLDLEEALELLPVVYDRVRERTPGLYGRSGAWWRHHTLRDEPEVRHGGGPMFRALVEIDGEPRAYALHRLHSKWDDGVPQGTLDVVETMADGPDALRAVWEYIFGVDLVGVIEVWNLPSTLPLQHMLTEPRRLRATLGDSIWARVVDVPSALGSRSYAVDETLVLEVTDPLLPDNEGRWALTISEGKASVERTEAPADLVMEIKDLGAIYLGGTKPSELAAASRIRASSPEVLLLADAVFGWHIEPWCMEIF